MMICTKTILVSDRVKFVFMCIMMIFAYEKLCHCVLNDSAIKVELVIFFYYNAETPDLCFLCDVPITVKFDPCGHSPLCHNCARRAKKCPDCKVSALYVLAS